MTLLLSLPWHLVLQPRAQGGGDTAPRPAAPQLVGQHRPLQARSPAPSPAAALTPSRGLHLMSGQLGQDRERHMRAAVVTFLCHGTSSSVSHMVRWLHVCPGAPIIDPHPHPRGASSRRVSLPVLESRIQCAARALHSFLPFRLLVAAAVGHSRAGVRVTPALPLSSRGLLPCASVSCLHFPLAVSSLIVGAMLVPRDHIFT